MIYGIKGKHISMRASKIFQYSPYRRIIQKEVNRIAPIVPFVKGKTLKRYVKAQWYSSMLFIYTYIHIHTYIHTYIYIYIHIYIHT